MKGIRVLEYGDSTTLSYDGIPIPVLQESEVLVDIEIAGLNFIDIYMRNRLYSKSQTYAQSLPMTLGMEVAGIVKALGKSVTNLNLGIVLPIAQNSALMPYSPKLLLGKSFRYQRIFV